MSDEPIPTRGVVFDGPDKPPQIEELILDPPQRGEVLVRMAAAGVCHSDLHVVDGEWERPAGVVMGHEGAAWVERIGEDVEGLAPGDLVVLAWTAPCRACEAVPREANPGLCGTPDGSNHRLRPEDQRLHRPSGEPIGAYSGIGTFGEHQVVAASAAIKVDPRTPPEIAALIGCAVTTGLGAVRNTARVRAGESVVVIGLGGVGLAAVMGAVAAGRAPDHGHRHVRRRSWSWRFGPVPTGFCSPARQSESAGADHVLECIGLVETVEMAIDLVRPGGTVTLVGMTPQGSGRASTSIGSSRTAEVIRGSNYGSSDPAIDFPRIATRVPRGQPAARSARRGAHRSGGAR